jgi:hypothetical protein
MATGEPVTSTLTAPQKQLPEYVITITSLQAITPGMIDQADLRQGSNIEARFL